MKGFFTLLFGEIKKVILRPLVILIMAGFLIIALVASPKIFNPINKIDSSLSALPSSSVIAVYTEYFNSYKLPYDATLADSNEKINILLAGEFNDYDYLKDKVQKITTAYSLYHNAVVAESNTTAMSTQLASLKTHLQDFWNCYESCLGDYVYPIILVNEDVNFDIQYLVLNFLLQTKLIQTESSSLDFHKNIDSILITNDCISKINKYFDSIKKSNFDKDVLANVLVEYYQKATESNDNINNLVDINAEIVGLYNNAYGDSVFDSNSNNISTITTLVYKYISVCTTTNAILNNCLLLQLGNGNCDSFLRGCIGYENYNSYQINENLTKNKFLFNNNKFDFEYGNVMAVNSTSNKNTNMYDYVYFTLELTSLIVIIYAIIIGSSMIAKEQNDGTMKLLAIRPFKRSKIMFAKICATMVLALMFVALVLIISSITGAIMFGISSAPVLAVFNSGSAFVTSQFLLIIVQLISLILEILVYVLLSIAVSTLFKSYAGAIATSFAVFFVNIILTFIGAGANWLKFIPFANLKIYKYFGGAFASGAIDEANVFSKLLHSTISSGTSFIYTALLLILFIVGFNLISFLVFNKRDIN